MTVGMVGCMGIGAVTKKLGGYTNTKVCNIMILKKYIYRLYTCMHGHYKFIFRNTFLYALCIYNILHDLYFTDISINIKYMFVILYVFERNSFNSFFLYFFVHIINFYNYLESYMQSLVGLV